MSHIVSNTNCQQSTIYTVMIHGMIIVGDPLDAIGYYGVTCVSTPDKLATENGTKLGKQVALLAKKLKV